MSGSMTSIVILKTQKEDNIDASARQHPTWKETTVFAYSKSIKMTEYYEASRNAIAVSRIFGMNIADYEAAAVIVEGKKVKPKMLVADGTKYRIVRAYEMNDVIVELTVAEVE